MRGRARTITAVLLTESAGLVPVFLGGSDYDPDPADQSQSILVLLIPLGLVVLAIVAAVLVVRSRRRAQNGAEATHPRPRRSERGRSDRQ